MKNKKYIKIINKRLKAGDSVLEIGCGDGELINELVDSNKELGKVMAIDYYRAPKNLNSKIQFSQQSVESFVFEEKFDLVIIKHVLEHIKNPLGLIERIKKNLNKHGKIFIVVPNRYGFQNEARVYLPEHGKHYFLWDKESLEFSLERLGFTCRFHGLNEVGNKFYHKIFSILLKMQNSEIICVASLDD